VRGQRRVTGALKEVLNVMRVKDRIQLFYRQAARLESDLNAFKEEHGYCVGRPFCMEYVGAQAKKRTCSACSKANANPRYKKQVSEYGRLRRKERAEEKRAKAAPVKRRERKAA
jgi:hypothetical protein